MAKKFDYFKAFETQAEFGLQAADFLKQTLCSYNRHSLMLALESMHTIEGKADAVNHEIREHLRLDFVTPVEREDISQLSQCLDDVVDTIEDVLMGFYMYHVSEINDEMLAMMDTLQQSTAKLLAAIRKFSTFRKSSEEILPLLIDVNDAESAGDRLFLEAMHKTYNPEENKTPTEIMALSCIYNCFENALDSVEHCASLTEEIIMTNL